MLWTLFCLLSCFCVQRLCRTAPAASTSSCYFMEAYWDLERRFTRLYRLDHALEMLGWDQVVNQPLRGADARVSSIAEIKVIRHQLLTDPKMSLLLNQASLAPLSSDQRGNLREMRRVWMLATKLPENLVQKLAAAKGKAEKVWRTARSKNDWEKFKPELEEVIRLTKEEAKFLQQGTDLSLYEAIVAKYEPGLRVSTIDKLFNDLKTWLPELIQNTQDRQKAVAKEHPIVQPEGPFEVKSQKACGEQVMQVLGFDFDRGRLDTSAHPFCGGVPEDVRLTTRYRIDDFSPGLLKTIHETGHALYEQNRPQEFITSPGSCIRSMAIHESQSLLFEMQVGRSLPFQRVLSPLLNRFLGDSPVNRACFEPANLFRRVNTVQPNFIRIDADEMTYPMHIILRYELEVALIEGTADVNDIPAIWASKMKEYLGVDTATTGPDGGHNYKDGCMQDIHWSLGHFGYFPSYTLGAMYAAQFMAAIRRDKGEDVVSSALARGNLSELYQWLKDNVWSKGSLLETDDVVRLSTGEVLNASHFRTHLETRYGLTYSPVLLSVDEMTPPPPVTQHPEAPSLRENINEQRVSKNSCTLNRRHIESLMLSGGPPSPAHHPIQDMVKLPFSLLALILGFLPLVMSAFAIRRKKVRTSC